MWTDFKQPQYLRDYQRKKPAQESEKGEPEILGEKKKPRRKWQSSVSSEYC